MEIKKEKYIYGKYIFAELSHIDLRWCEFFDLSRFTIGQLKLL